MVKFHVVLIEDNPADVVLVRLALKENALDCDLTVFHTGQEALKALVPGLPSPDLILMDLNTGPGDGFYELIRLRSTPHLAEVPVAVITSSEQDKDRARSLNLGATSFIHKPSQLDEFLITVGQAVKALLRA